MKSLQRIAWRVIIRLHPESFRNRFGDEMLWIFDEMSRDDSSAHFFLDGLRSLVLQHTRPRPATSACVFYREINSALPAHRLAQAGFAILSILFCFALMLSPWMPGPKLAAPAYTGSRVHQPEQRSWILTHIFNP
jgi:hypothetical protein